MIIKQTPMLVQVMLFQAIHPKFTSVLALSSNYLHHYSSYEKASSSPALHSSSDDWYVLHHNKHEILVKSRNTNLNTRRNFLSTLGIAITATTSMHQQPVNAMDNPLNLKGTFWETGQLYQKSNKPLPSSDDESDFFSILEKSVDSLHSSILTESISEGKYGQASRLLRGGLISESKIRIAANALIDLIPEENDVAIYKSNESFRIFLRYLDVLDAEVEAASRSLFGGSGERDPRIKILTRLGEVEDALKVFLRNVRRSLDDQ